MSSLGTGFVGIILSSVSVSVKLLTSSTNTRKLSSNRIAPSWSSLPVHVKNVQLQDTNRYFQ